MSYAKEYRSKNIDKLRSYAKEYYREYRQGKRRNNKELTAQNSLKKAISCLSDYENRHVNENRVFELIIELKSIEKRFNEIIESNFL
jgi:hypothetical protein